MKKLILILVVVFAIIGCGSEKETKLNGRIELRIVSKDETTIKLAWNSIPDIEGYKLFRNGSQIEIIGSGVTEYSDKGLYMGREYKYYVIGYRGSREMDPSNSVNAVTSDYEEVRIDDKFPLIVDGEAKMLSISSVGRKINYFIEYGDWGIVNCLDDDPTKWGKLQTGDIEEREINVICANANGTNILFGNGGELKILGKEIIFDIFNSTIKSINFFGNNEALVSIADDIKKIDTTKSGFEDIEYISNITKSGIVIFADRPYSDTDESKIIVAFENGKVNIYYSKDSYEKEIISPQNSKKIKLIKLNSNKKMLLTVYDMDNILEVRDIGTKTPDDWTKIKTFISTGDKIEYADMNSDGSKVIVGYKNENVSIYNEKGVLIKEISEKTDIKGVAISPDGKIIAIAIKNNIKIYKLN